MYTVYQIGFLKFKISAATCRKVLVGFMCVCGVIIIISGIIIFHETQRKLLTVGFLNVGQGDAIFIEAPNGNQILIDGGPSGSVVRELTAMLPFYDHSLDMVLATHPDSDHIGGLPDVISRYSVKNFIQTDVIGSSTLAQELGTRISRQNILVTNAQRGQRFILDADAEVFLDILFPDRSVTRLETNTASIVAMLRHKNISILLTGDSPKGVEKFLSEVDGVDLQANILKLGHHGSQTSSDEIFLTTVRPNLAIVSAGKNNRYKHPHKDVVARLEKLNIPYLTTFESRKVFQSDGEKIWEK